MHFAPVEQPPEVWLATKKNIFRDRTQRDQIDLLVDRTDAMILSLLRALKIDRVPIKQDSTTSARIGTGKDFDQGRFTCTILSNQRMNFCMLHAQIGVNQGCYARKVLRDMHHMKQWIGLGHSNILFSN